MGQNPEALGSTVPLQGGTTGGGGAPLSDQDPLPDAPVADPGVGVEASRWDHVHPEAAPQPRLQQHETYGQDFLLPSFNGDFPNGTPAVIAPDAVNPGIIEAQFAGGFLAPIGVYWNAYVPAWATKMRVQIVHRSSSGGPGNLGLSVYNRAVLNGAPVGAWIMTVMPDIAFVDTVPHYNVLAPAAGETLADWGMVPAVSAEGTLYQFIVERNVAPIVPPSLPGDWNLFGVIQTFYDG